MAMDFYFKDLYPDLGAVQTTESTVPDSHDKAEVVEDAKAGAVADSTTGSTASGKKILIGAAVIVCLAVFLGARR